MFVTHPVLKLHLTSCFSPALGTATDGFIQIGFFFDRLHTGRRAKVEGRASPPLHFLLARVATLSQSIPLEQPKGEPET
jgi:hypothetical protein